MLFEPPILKFLRKVVSRFVVDMIFVFTPDEDHQVIMAISVASVLPQIQVMVTNTDQ